MQIKSEQLVQRLQQNTLPIIWISGDDPLLVQEACDTVRQFAKAQGFGERHIMDAGKGFDWNLLLASANELSLFAERKLIDLRIGQARLEEDARTALMGYLENPNPDNLLLLTTAKIDKQAQGTKWFKALEAQCLFCPLWPVSERELPGWIRQRLQKLGLGADNDAVQVLADKIEGNLLAAAQEIEKLRILVAGDHLDVATVLEAVQDSSRYGIFSLTDACLAGNAERALKILQHLEAEGEDCLFIVNMLCRELRSLSAMRGELDSGHNINGVLQNHRVWSSRSQIVTRALQLHDQKSMLDLLDRARKVDQAVKGLLNLKPWDEVTDLVLGFSNPRLLVRMV
jgi:DNA polymerase III subunit delta